MDRPSPIRTGRATTFTISCWADVLACTQYSTEIARDAGFEERATWEIGIAVSELATNITRHAGGVGTISIGRAQEPACGLEIVAKDEGPGIEDIDAAMEDDYSRGRQLTGTPHADRGGLGAGLGAVARFMDDVRIDSTPERGTIVHAFKRLGYGRPARAPKPILLLGLGNSLLSDDAVGIHVARHIASSGTVPGVDVREAEVAGFALLDLLEGYDHAVVVDAVRLRDGRPGEVVIFDGNGMESSLHLVAGHQIDLPSAIELGRQLGRPVPNTVTVVGVQVEDDRTCSEKCTPAVEAAIPEAARIALRLAASSQTGVSALIS